jgi:hypothetical protein
MHAQRGRGAITHKLNPWPQYPTVHHHIHNRSTPVRVLSQSNTIDPQKITPTSTLIPSSHLHFGLPSGLLLSEFHTKTLYTLHSSQMRATFPAHFLRLDLIRIMISGEEYKLCTKFHKHFPVLRLYQTIRPAPRLCVVFRNKH